jgi:uncharacterized protein
MRLPKLMSPEVCEAFASRLERYLVTFPQSEITVYLHGGEPLLFGLDRTTKLLQRMARVSTSTGTKLRTQVTTNGLLVNERWAELFASFHTGVTVSIDGPADVHDARRVDFRDKGSHARTTKALAYLRKAGIDPGALAVCQPHASGRAVAEHLHRELGISRFDVLFPHVTHEDAAPPSIARFYIELFEYVVEATEPLFVRCIDSMIRVILHRPSRCAAVGRTPHTGLTLSTDGRLHVDDIMRCIGEDAIGTEVHVVSDDIEKIYSDVLWREVYESSLTRPAGCVNCRHYDTCAGGQLNTRWSNEHRFDNPSVYCQDLLAIYDHASERIQSSLYREHGVA